MAKKLSPEENSETLVFVIFNSETKKYRSGRTTGGYKKQFSSAVIYTHRFQADRAAKNNNDIVIPVELRLDPQDLFAAVLKGPG